MILVWGRGDDEPAVAVARELAAVGADHVFVDQDRAEDIRLTGSGPRTRRLEVDRLQLPLRSVTALYLRCSLRPDDSPAAVRLWTGLMQLADTWPAFVVNRPSTMAANDSKPWQARQLRESGLIAPPTLVTNDVDQVSAFVAEHGRVIFKSTSGTRSIVAELDPGDLNRLASLHTCPTQFQQLVTGVNHRVHVVGDQVFTAAVTSTALDYRYAGRANGWTRMSSASLPDEVADACRRAARAGGLPLAGIDLIHADDGRWLCLEMNPSPAFTWFAELTGDPIAAAVADLLIAGPPAPTSGSYVSTRSPHLEVRR